MTAEKPPMDIEWLAVSKGLAFSQDAHVCVVFAPLNPDGSMGEEHVWRRRKGLTRAFVGGVFSIMGNALFNSIVPEVKFVRQWDNKEDIAAWTASTMAVLADAELRKKGRAAHAVDHIGDLLAPIRKEWAKASPLGRAAIEAGLLRALRRGR